MKKILTVVGARPQFIKASVVSNALANSGGFKETLIHTGQHYDKNMSDIFFYDLNIKSPDYNLGIGGGCHGKMTGLMLAGIESVILKEQPDLILLYGDTNSTLAGALAAVKLQLPIAHVEAGLRSYNRKMPEEINRVLTDQVSSILFAPSEVANSNLLLEGFQKEDIHLVGDVMYDVALKYGSNMTKQGREIERNGLVPKKFILATIHRPENTDSEQKLRTIFEALVRLTAKFQVIIPLHPRTRKMLKNIKMFDYLVDKLVIVDPLGYLDMLQLTKFAAVVVTDSGGLQKEAYFHRSPCLTLREETEWHELIDSGWNKLAIPEDVNVIEQSVLQTVGSIGQRKELYGDGNAAEKICNIIGLY